MSRRVTIGFVVTLAVLSLLGKLSGAAFGDTTGTTTPPRPVAADNVSINGDRNHQSSATLPSRPRAVDIVNTNTVVPESESLEKRISVLEGRLQDASAVATVFVFVVGILVAANAGLSVWQVGSLAQKEVETAIAKYDDQFHGFLSQRKDQIAERLTRYGESVSSVSRQIHEVSMLVQGHEDFVSETINSVDKLTREAVFKLREEGRRQREGLRKANVAVKRKIAIDENS